MEISNDFKLHVKNHIPVASLRALYNISKNHKKFKQHPINIKNYTPQPHDIVYIRAKFRRNTDIRLRVTVRKQKGDRHTD